MKTRHNYQRLTIYSRSLDHAVKIIEICDSVRPYRLGEQIAGSCTSIPSNIAEGSQRGSDKEFVRFLSCASGSAAELETQLQILHRAKKCKEYPIIEWIEESVQINAMIRNFMNRLSVEP